MPEKTKHFNPRTHMGCDIVRIKDIQRDQISIHAPTWGATTSGSQAWLIGAFQSTHPHGVRPVNHKGVLGVERISIHAPTWGATRRACTSIHRPQTSFQSTHPHGVRQLQVRVDQQTLDISIHAPTWGATGLSTAICGLFIVGHSRHPHGVRQRQTNMRRTARFRALAPPTWGATG